MGGRPAGAPIFCVGDRLVKPRGAWYYRYWISKSTFGHLDSAPAQLPRQDETGFSVRHGDRPWHIEV